MLAMQSPMAEKPLLRRGIGLHDDRQLVQENAMKLMTPFDFMAPMLEASRIMAESQMVIGMRLAGLAGLWPMAQSETNRMMSEKLSAGLDSAHAALRTGMAGGNISDVAMAAMKPVRAKTRANAKRLQRKVTGG
jgi:hypothetical protein